MKKIFIFILAVLICISTFSACGKSEQGTTQSSTSQQLTTQQTTVQPPTSQKPVVEMVPPNDKYTYDFTSYDEMIQALTMENTEEFKALRAEQERWGKVYCDTLSAFASGDIKVAIPQFDGGNMKLRENERLPIISFLTSELYKLPWVWYHCIFDGYSLAIRVAYPGVLGSAEINSASSYLEVLSLIASRAPSPDNYHEYENYKKIYEKEIVLADGRKYTAMISELKDSSNEYVMLYQDGMLIMLYADNQLFTEDFWSSFSMAQYDATQDDTSVELTEKA